MTTRAVLGEMADAAARAPYVTSHRNMISWMVWTMVDMGNLSVMGERDKTVRTKRDSASIKKKSEGRPIDADKPP
jgi:hypothetical protein